MFIYKCEVCFYSTYSLYTHAYGGSHTRSLTHTHTYTLTHTYALAHTSVRMSHIQRACRRISRYIERCAYVSELFLLLFQMRRCLCVGVRAQNKCTCAKLRMYRLFTHLVHIFRWNSSFGFTGGKNLRWISMLFWIGDPHWIFCCFPFLTKIKQCLKHCLAVMQHGLFACEESRICMAVATTKQKTKIKTDSM